MNGLLRCTAPLLLALAFVPASRAEQRTVTFPPPPDVPLNAQALPPGLEDVGFEQRLGEELPLDLHFVDSHGETVRVGDLFADRPVLIAPVYFDCPMLCPLVLDGVVRNLKPLTFDPGTHLEVLAVSFDPRESPTHSAAARTHALERYARPGTEDGWHFLTGDEESVERLMTALGFRYRWDEESQQFAHAGGIVLATPDGVVSRYFLGVDYAPKELRLALVDASDGQIGSLAEQVFLYCFRYDPAVGRYSAVILNVVKLGGLLTLVAFVAFLLLMWRWERRRSSLEEVQA
jgi:protein SCO1/2